jgi:hypothetical protein
MECLNSSAISTVMTMPNTVWNTAWSAGSSASATRSAATLQDEVPGRGEDQAGDQEGQDRQTTCSNRS